MKVFRMLLVSVGIVTTSASLAAADGKVMAGSACQALYNYPSHPPLYTYGDPGAYPAGGAFLTRDITTQVNCPLVRDRQNDPIKDVYVRLRYTSLGSHEVASCRVRIRAEDNGTFQETGTFVQTGDQPIHFDMEWLFANTSLTDIPEGTYSVWCNLPPDYALSSIHYVES